MLEKTSASREKRRGRGEGEREGGLGLGGGVVAGRGEGTDCAYYSSTEGLCPPQFVQRQVHFFHFSLSCFFYIIPFFPYQLLAHTCKEKKTRKKEQLKETYPHAQRRGQQT
jgi:hypothetical protein